MPYRSTSSIPKLVLAWTLYGLAIFDQEEVMSEQSI